MVTKSKGIGRGGKRPRAGRKPKKLISDAKRPEVLEAAKARIEKIVAASEGPATALAAVAYATLEDVMANSLFQAPRVTAARAIIELAKDELLARAGAVSGKKAQRQANAENVGGKFAVPSAPKLAVDNTR